MNKLLSSSTELKRNFQQRALDFQLAVQVIGDGPLSAEIAIVGESPDHQAVLQKLPFVGASGKLVWDNLRRHNILRTKCYATNVCKHQLSIAKAKRNDLSHDDKLKWQTLLHWELSQLPNLKYILAFGENALNALQGFTSITKYRGSVFDTVINNKPLQVLYTFNPAAIIRQPKDQIIFHFDLHRFAQLTKGDWRPHVVDTVHSMDYNAILRCIHDYRISKKPTTTDIEWTAKATACIGLSNDPHLAHCINFRDGSRNLFTLQQEADIYLALQDLYEDRDITIIAQNGNFDSHATGFFDNINMPIDYDTMLAHHTLYPSLPHSLAFLTSMYTTHPYYKDEGSEARESGNMDQFWNYNGKDCALTLAVYQGTKRELEQSNQYDFFMNHVMKLQPHLIQSTIHGIAVDDTIKNKIADDLAVDLDKQLTHFNHQCNIALGTDDYTCNPNSPKQLKTLLYGLLNLKHRSQSTNAQARDDMLQDGRTSREAKEVIVALNQYKQDFKFYSTYATTLVDPDHRMRCSWKQHGVINAPGRLSSSKTLWQTGMNLQNQPPKARQFYVADPNCVLIYFDLSQAEARVVGYVADIDQWKEDFERARISGNFDCHRSLAASMFNFPYDDVPTADIIDDQYTIRYIAKRCRHGLNYRMQIHRLAETTGLSFGKSASSYHTYHKLNPEIKLWWDETVRIVKRDRCLVNAYGRKLPFLQRLDENAMKSIVAFYPQSTIGDKVCRVWYQSQEDDRWDSHKARIVINIHDALIAVATREYADTALSIMKAYAEEPILIQNVYKTKTEQLIVPADCKKSVSDDYGKHRWSTLEDYHIEAAKI